MKKLLTIFFLALSLSGFGQPSETNRLGWTGSSLTINGADSTITIGTYSAKLRNVDFDITLGYIPVQTFTTIDLTDPNSIDTAFTNHRVPVNLLFGNIDYKNQIYFRILPHVVDNDSVESLPARLTEIAVYSASNDQNTYFGVPAEGTAKWIDPNNGVDATGTGTKALPYKTHSKVNGLTLTEGTNVYVMSGQIGTIAWAKNYNLKVIGYCKITSASGSRGIDYDPAGTLTQTIEGYHIDMNSIAVSVGWNGALLHRLNFKRMLIQEHGGSGFQSAVLATNLIDFDNVIIKTGTNGIYANKNLYIRNANIYSTSYNILRDNSGYNLININNSTLYSTTSFMRNYGDVDLYINDSRIIFNGTMFSTNAGTKGFQSFKNSYIERYATSNGTILAFDDIDYDSVIVFNCELKAGKGNVYCLNQHKVRFQNNLMLSTAANASVYFSAINTTVGNHTDLLVSGNKMTGKDAVSIIGVGDISGVQHNSVNAIIEKNDIDYKQFSSHGINFHNNDTGIIRYNRVMGSGSGIVVKSYSTTDNYITSYSTYNILINTQATIKGVLNYRYFNNVSYFDDTVTSSNIDAVNCLSMSANDEVPCQTKGGIVKNNIFIYRGSDNKFTHIRNDTLTNDYDYNLYYNENFPVRFLNESDTLNFAQWQTLGYDSHSKVLTEAEFNNLFIDANAHNFVVNSNSAAVNAGVNLGSAFQTGLSPSTLWNAADIPDVQLTNQSASWTIGAYVVNAPSAISVNRGGRMLLLMQNGKLIVY